MDTSIKKTDVLILGGGIAGTSAAIKASQLGKSVILIEKENLGGTCLNWGCIPTKFLWETLDFERKIKKSYEYGFDLENKKINFKSIQQKKERVVELLKNGLKKRLENHSVEVIEGTANFLDDKNVEIVPSLGTKKQIEAEKIIIATGSKPKELAYLHFDHTKILNSNDILNLEENPKSILVIGAGAVGVELSTILSGFGTSVTLLEKENQVLPGEHTELAGEVKKILEKQGIKVFVGIKDLGEFINQADKILIATGRKPDIEKLQLEKANVKYGQQGIIVNEYLQTSNENIFACGDVLGKHYLAYVAQTQAITACENALGSKKTSDLPVIPYVVFSNPPIASVGIKEKDYNPNEVITGHSSYAANPKSFIEGERTGWIKIIADKKTGNILGGQIAGSNAENLITIIALSIKHKLSVKDISKELFFHPCLAEIIQNACEDALNKLA